MLRRDPADGPALDVQDLGLDSILAGLPGAAVLVFDLDTCVRFAEGDEFQLQGIDTASLQGRRLSEVLPATSWARLKGPYEDALGGRPSRFDFSSREVVYSIHVSPRRSQGMIVGAVAVTQDVTDLRRLESLVSAQDAVAHEAERWFEMSNDMLATASLNGYFTRLNSSWERCLGYSAEYLMSRPYVELVHPEDLEATLAVAASLADGPSEIVNFENRYQAQDGTWHWLLWSCRSDPQHLYAVAKDITERKEAELALRSSARRLRSILDSTPGALSVKGRDRRYQLVNREFEQRLGLEPDWILGRRDEEILPARSPSAIALDRESDDLVLRTGEVIEAEAEQPDDGQVRVHLSVKFPLRDEDGEIYAVCTIVNDIADRRRREEELQERLDWTRRIHGAIANDLLVLHGQPIVNLVSGEVEQAELLVRMLDPEDPGALIPPGDFLPAAERHQLIGAVDLWVVNRAVELAEQGHRVEINLSGQTISNPERIAEIERLVVASRAPPQNIIFEITETAAAENLGSARLFADRLRGLGCSFALDDFGVGFGAFTYLKYLRVDYLKIDAEFVRDLVSDEADRQVVRTIVGVAHDFGMRTIAEGVEDQETLELLRRMGVTYAQGFWLGRPAPIGEGVFENRLTPAEAARPPTAPFLPATAAVPQRRTADLGAGELAGDLREALRHGDSKAAEEVVDAALRSGLDVAAVHARLIAPAMDEIGALWEQNEISVGEEHLATAISHGLAARIFPRALRASPRSRERVMLAAVQGEHHVLGLRLAADVLEGAGYDVLYLGADVPLSSLLEACRRHEPEVLGLAVSMWLNVPTLIWQLERLEELDHPPAIMVGGRAVGPALAQGLRAPVITDSERILDVVAKLIAEPRVRNVVGPGLRARIPAQAPAVSSAAEITGTLPAGFSATSLAAADAVRESARHAFGLEQLVYRDGLTGLYNRRAFDDRFLELSEQASDQSVMLMIDVDEFKSINDGYGHQAGDEMLVTVARTILQAIRPGDFAARFGGDEFVVLLPGTSEADGASIAERIRGAVESAAERPPLTLSIGLAPLSSDNRLTSQSADRALYRAKESGRNRVARSQEVA